MLEMGDSIDEVLNLLEDVLYDEEDAYDNIPENLQGSWRAMESEDAIDTLNDASDLLTDIQNAGGTDEEEKKRQDSRGNRGSGGDWLKHIQVGSR